MQSARIVRVGVGGNLGECLVHALCDKDNFTLQHILFAWFKFPSNRTFTQFLVLERTFRVLKTIRVNARVSGSRSDTCMILEECRHFGVENTSESYHLAASRKCGDRIACCAAGVCFPRIDPGAVLPPTQTRVRRHWWGGYAGLIQ